MTKPTDFIEIKVEKDGDVILIKREEPGEQNGPGDLIFSPTKNLCYGVNELVVLEAELLSYGCIKSIVKSSIIYCLTGNYNEEVIVR